MRRRDLFAALASAFVGGGPRNARAADRVVGLLAGLPQSNNTVVQRLAAFREGLSGFGWAEGGNLRFEYRFEPDHGRLGARATDLVNGGCDVIVAWSTPETLAAMSATRAIPIVFLAVADPIGSGIVQSLAKPGGNVTGTTNFEPSLGSKWVDVLRDLAPGTARVAVLTNTANPAERRMQTAVEEAVAKYGMEVAVIAAERPDDLKKALDNFGGTPDGGVVVIPGIATNGSSRLIVDSAARLRLPAVYPFRFFTDAGGLASYGVGALELTRLARRAAAHVDRILHGASPTDLPVEGPTNFELVLNLTTAKRLGLTMSQAVLVAADEVIE